MKKIKMFLLVLVFLFCLSFSASAESRYFFPFEPFEFGDSLFKVYQKASAHDFSDMQIFDFFESNTNIPALVAHTKYSTEDVTVDCSFVFKDDKLFLIFYYMTYKSEDVVGTVSAELTLNYNEYFSQKNAVYMPLPNSTTMQAWETSTAVCRVFVVRALQSITVFYFDKKLSEGIDNFDPWTWIYFSD